MLSASVCTKKHVWNEHFIWNCFKILCVCVCAYFLTIIQNCIDLVSELQKLNLLYPRNKSCLGQQESLRKEKWAFSWKKKRERELMVGKVQKHHWRKIIHNQRHNIWCNSSDCSWACPGAPPGKRRSRKRWNIKQFCQNLFMALRSRAALGCSLECRASWVRVAVRGSASRRENSHSNWNGKA